MARSPETIYDEISLEQQNQPELEELQPDIDNAQTLLADLKSPSKVKDSRLWKWIFSVCASKLEDLWDLFKAEVLGIAKRAVPGTKSWYGEKILEFQYGDDIIFVDNVPQYLEVDESKKIIKHVAIVELSDGTVLIKVATEAGGEITPLTNPQILALKAYTNKIGFAGTKFDFLSLNADLLKLQATIFYSALFERVVITAAVETAINTYLNNLPFNGTVVINKLIDSVQAVEGVYDIKISLMQVKNGIAAYQSFERYWQTIAGYIKIDPDFALADTLIYTTSNV